MLSLEEKLDRLLKYALEPETCLKMCFHGSCDAAGHVCRKYRGHIESHKCWCGKAWDECSI